MLDGVTLAYCPKFDHIKAAMEAVKPTIFVAVPRVYEKIRQGVEGKSHGLKKAILNWALSVGKRHRQETLDHPSERSSPGRQPGGLSWALANALVFSKIRAAFGGRVGCSCREARRWGWTRRAGSRMWAFGFLEGYGLTETSPVIGAEHPAEIPDRYGGPSR